MRTSAFIGVGCLLGALAVAPRARAAGFYITDIGAKGVARAGALVAAPEGPLAVHYNPAGLSLSKGLQLELSMSLVTLEAQFQRKCPCVDPSVYGEGTAAADAALEADFDGNPEETSASLLVPFLGLSYGFEPWDLAIGLAAYAPNAGRSELGLIGSAQAGSFPQIARYRPGRYSALEAPNLELNYALALSFSPIEGLSVGAGVYFFQAGASQRLHLYMDASRIYGPEDPNWDVPVLVDFLSDPGFNWGAGISYALPFLKELSVGASFRAAREISARGTIDVDLPTNIAELGSVQGKAIDVSLETAPIVRAGVQYRWPGLFAVEAAWVWEGWSVTDQVLIDPVDATFQLGDNSFELDDIVYERHWRDTWSLRLGGELELWKPAFAAQLGYFYEPSAIPQEWLDVSRIDLDKHGFSVGLNAEWRGIGLVVSGMYVMMDSVEVTEGRAHRITPVGLLSDEPHATTVNNGVYSGSYWIANASLSFSLDRFLADG